MVLQRLADALRESVYEARTRLSKRRRSKTRVGALTEGGQRLLVRNVLTWLGSVCVKVELSKDSSGEICGVSFGGATYLTFWKFLRPSADAGRIEGPLPVGCADGRHSWSKAALASLEDGSKSLPIDVKQDPLVFRRASNSTLRTARSYKFEDYFVDLATVGMDKADAKFLLVQSGSRKGQLQLAARGALLKAALEPAPLFSGFFPEVDRQRDRRALVKNAVATAYPPDFSREALSQVLTFAASREFQTRSRAYWYYEWGRCARQTFKKYWPQKQVPHLVPLSSFILVLLAFNCMWFCVRGLEIGKVVS